MDLFQPFQEPVLKLWEDDTLWSKFVAHDFWKAHHSNPDQKSANDVTLVLLKKNIQFLIINAASLQESLGVNFLDPVFQEDLLHRVAWGRRHLHRKLAGTEQEQKWKTLVATRIHSDWPKVAGKVVTIVRLVLADHLRKLSPSEMLSKEASGQRCQCDPYHTTHYNAEKQDIVGRLQWTLSDNPLE